MGVYMHSIQKVNDLKSQYNGLRLGADASQLRV